MTDQHRNLEDWTRDGFTGERAMIERAHYTPAFISADGPHVPRRLDVHHVATSAVAGPPGTPIVLAATATGVRLGVARHDASMPYVLRNVECDEVHFVQDGAVQFRTGFGTVDARAGDFVCIPRSVAYQILLLERSALTLVVESPPAVRLRPQEGPGAVDHLRGVWYPELDAATSRGETTLLLKSGDEFSRFVLPEDPLCAVTRVGGVKPVWKVSLAEIPPKIEGSPVPFLGTSGNDLLLFTLSASPRKHRPPIHVNADYDEVILFAAGPGAWGEVNEPGTLTWVPKGVTHNGPSENVPDGYQAWLLESRATWRFTPAALAVADVMETGLYGRHQGSRSGVLSA